MKKTKKNPAKIKALLTNESKPRVYTSATFHGEAEAHREARFIGKAEVYMSRWEKRKNERN